MSGAQGSIFSGDPAMAPETAAHLGIGPGEETRSLHERPANHQHFNTESAAVVLSGRFAELDVLREDERARVTKVYDATLKREILLKSIRVAASDQALRDRILSAAQAMAKVSQSSIANVYGVRGESDSVVLMMELIMGEPLSMWRKHERRGWRESLRLLLRAGEGLAAAHEQGLVHGGLHPGNIFVAEDRAWVTDVGIATRCDEETLAYLAPEHRAGAVPDERADQYSFCVILSELLSGLSLNRRPGQFGWSRQTRVPRAVAVAIERGLSPAPAERFPAMSELLAVLRKSLGGRGHAYKSAAVALPLAIVSAGGAWMWQMEQGSRCTGAGDQIAEVWRPELRERVRAAMNETGLGYAQETYTRVQGALDAYAVAWTQQHQEACEATAVHGQQSDDVLDLRMSCLQRARLGLGAAVEILQRADAQVVEHAVELTTDLPPLSRCADIDAMRMQVPPPEDPEAVRRVELARAELSQAGGLEIAGKYAEALERVQHARDAVEGVRYAPILAELSYREGALLDQLGRFEEAEGHLVRSLETAVSSGLNPEGAQAAARAAFVLASRRNRPQEAWRPAMLGRDLSASVEAQPAVRGEAENSVGVTLLKLGRLSEAAQALRHAIALREEGLGPAHPLVADSRLNLAVVLLIAGHPIEAENAAREVLASRRHAFGDGHPRVADSYSTIAVCLKDQGRYVEAEEMMRKVVVIRESALPPAHPLVAGAYNHLGFLLMRRGLYEAAAAEFERALNLWLSHQPDYEVIGYALDNLGLIHLHQHRAVEAEHEFRRAIAFRRRVLPPTDSIHAESRMHLGQALAGQDRLVEARVELEDALAHSINTLGTAHHSTAAVATALGQVLFTLGDQKAAREQLEHAWSVYSQQPVAPELRGEAALALARVLSKMNGNRARARELATRAQADFEAAGALWQRQAREARRWLETHT